MVERLRGEKSAKVSSDPVSLSGQRVGWEIVMVGAESERPVAYIKPQAYVFSANAQAVCQDGYDCLDERDTVLHFNTLNVHR